MRKGKQQIPLFEEADSGAVISGCGVYRYQLWRIWDPGKPLVLWIMHNPSKADAVHSDNTIDKIIRFTRSWGYGGLYVGNLFPYRSTDPSELKRAGYDIAARDENMHHVAEMAAKCNLKILAHGNPALKRWPNIMGLRNDWHYLKMTNSGNPYHPLYLKSDLKPIPLYQND